jgi:hypothetical protein
MNYKVQWLEGNYYIIESSTDQVIRSFNSKKKAMKFYRFLENGGAFDGFTPSFMFF